VIRDSENAVYKFRQCAIHKQHCSTKLYKFHWNRLELINYIDPNRADR
jgi:hypothetical protein